MGMSIPVGVYFDRYSQVAGAMHQLSWPINPVSLLTHWLDDGIWFPQYDQYVLASSITTPAVAQTQYIIFNPNPTSGSFVVSLDGVDAAPISYNAAELGLIKFDLNGALSSLFGGVVPGGLLEEVVGGFVTAVITPVFGTSLLVIKNNTTTAVITPQINDPGSPATPVGVVTGPGATVWTRQYSQPTTTWLPQYTQPVTTWTAQ